jgi:hypothetical protein
LKEKRWEDPETEKERKVKKRRTEKNPEIEFDRPVAPLGEKIP